MNPQVFRFTPKAEPDAPWLGLDGWGRSARGSGPLYETLVSDMGKARKSVAKAEALRAAEGKRGRKPAAWIECLHAGPGFDSHSKAQLRAWATHVLAWHRRRCAPSVIGGAVIDNGGDKPLLRLVCTAQGWGGLGQRHWRRAMAGGDLYAPFSLARARAEVSAMQQALFDEVSAHHGLGPPPEGGAAAGQEAA